VGTQAVLVLRKGASLFSLFLQEIISGRSFFAAGTLGSERRVEHKNSGIGISFPGLYLA
jgi:hypothetical protein